MTCNGRPGSGPGGRSACERRGSPHRVNTMAAGVVALEPDRQGTVDVGCVKLISAGCFCMYIIFSFDIFLAICIPIFLAISMVGLKKQEK